MMVREELDRQAETEWEPGSNLEIDFSSVSFMDSTGLHWLLDLRARALDMERTISLVVPEGGVIDKMLQISGCTESFSIYRVSRGHALDGDAS
jgi:anti-anti-sigma factor